MHIIEIEHKTSTGHRIPGHEDGRGKCARLHGHTFGYFVQLSAEILDDLGLVADFGRVKAVLDRWDHRTLLWENDTIRLDTRNVHEDFRIGSRAIDVVYDMVETEAGIVRVPFIPTSENMAVHLAETFIREFDNLVFASVDVRESPLSCARYYCSKADVAQQDQTEVTEKWPGEK